MHHQREHTLHMLQGHSLVRTSSSLNMGAVMSLLLPCQLPHPLADDRDRLFCIVGERVWTVARPAVPLATRDISDLLCM